ncbi:HlyD family secretion protein [Macellibacteroides fermentans]|uniref:HlyD family secretion protein n=1 Tax=Macellibacteroides fermentans TaxID=879969 RepID=UPI002CA6EB0F|nr:HlyD family efflux transporter periplasmic adaptor subunit [Macellibacteroides fermentans]
MKTLKNTMLFLAALLPVACSNNKTDYDASGIFESTEVIVSSQVSGQLMEFTVTEGQQLQADSYLGYVDTTQLYLKKQQLMASRTAVSSRSTSVPRQIASLKEQIATQKRELARFGNLVKLNAANQKQVDDIQSQLSVLEKQLAAQTELLVNNNQGISGESTALESQIAQIEDQLLKSRITSPIQGTVLTKYAEQGEFTAPGKALFKVSDMQQMYLRAYITSDQLTQLKQGQPVTVYADFGEDKMRTYPGTISWIADKAEFTPKTIQTRNERANLVYAVKIAVTNDGYLKNGMYGEVKFNATKP